MMCNTKVSKDRPRVVLAGGVRVSLSSTSCAAALLHRRRQLHRLTDLSVLCIVVGRVVPRVSGITPVAVPS